MRIVIDRVMGQLTIAKKRRRLTRYIGVNELLCDDTPFLLIIYKRQ